MDHDQRGGAREFDAEITIADGVQAVARDFVETQRACYGVTIDRMGSSGQRRGAKRQDIDPLANVGKSFTIACQHFEISETPVGEEHGLSTLKMRVTRNRCLRMSFGEIKQSFLRTA